MKFSLHTLLLTTALIGISIGWIVDRQSFPEQEQIDSGISDSVQLGLVMGSTMQSNRIFEQLESFGEVELTEIRAKKLIENVLDMAAYEQSAIALEDPWRAHSKNAGMPDSSAFLSLAGKSLQLLEIDSVSQFEQLLLIRNITEYAGLDILQNGRIDSKIAEFIETAIGSIRE